jgi:signal transduction histidine kinase
LFRVRQGVVRAKKEGSDLNIQFRIIKKDGMIRWILCRAGSIKNDQGRITGFSGINVDITEQKSIEQRLRKAESELLSALQIRDEFFAIASHELKTPLTSLKLQTQVHQRALENNDPRALSRSGIERLLVRNYQQSERLNRLVDDMLDISRIRTGKLTIKKELCEISHIVKGVAARFKEQLSALGSEAPTIITHGVFFGNWDLLRIEQVISNIMNNAIRYGLGKPIKIIVSESKRECQDFHYRSRNGN